MPEQKCIQILSWEELWMTYLQIFTAIPISRNWEIQKVTMEDDG